DARRYRAAIGWKTAGSREDLLGKKSALPGEPTFGGSVGRDREHKAPIAKARHMNVIRNDAACGPSGFLMFLNRRLHRAGDAPEGLPRIERAGCLRHEHSVFAQVAKRQAVEHVGIELVQPCV